MPLNIRSAEFNRLAEELAARKHISKTDAVFEGALGLRSQRHASVAEALADVQAFLAIAGVRTVSITGKGGEPALDAFAR